MNTLLIKSLASIATATIASGALIPAPVNHNTTTITITSSIAIVDTPAVNDNRDLAVMKIDGFVDSLASCESDNDGSVINPNDAGSPSYGLLQYKRPTWSFYIRKYNLLPNLTESQIQKKILDEKIQRQLTAMILLKEKSGWRHWYNCSKKIGIDKEIQMVYTHMDVQVLSKL